MINLLGLPLFHELLLLPAVIVRHGDQYCIVLKLFNVVSVHACLPRMLYAY